jgi:hypothetical protein
MDHDPVPNQKDTVRTIGRHRGDSRGARCVGDVLDYDGAAVGRHLLGKGDFLGRVDVLVGEWSVVALHTNAKVDLLPDREGEVGRRLRTLEEVVDDREEGVGAL